MTNPEPPDQTSAVWPPAIALPSPVLPDFRYRKTAYLAKASLWAIGAGVVCYGGIAVALSILAAMSRINADEYNPVHYLNVFIHVSYAAGLVCNVSAIMLGLLGRGVKAGRIGLALSIGALCLTTAWTLINHHKTGAWIWSATVGDDGSCGCP